MDPYRDVAALYDCEHDAFQDDIAFYLDQMIDGPVLEVGTGTGRIALALLRSGLELWGVDPSAAMLDRARNRLAEFTSAHLMLGTVSDLPAQSRFGTAIVPLNTLWHLPDNVSQILLLEEVRSRLTPEGLLFVDLSNPLALAERGSRGECRERFSGRCGNGYLTVLSAAWDDQAGQQLSLSLTYDMTDVSGSVRRSHADFRFRYLYRFELELILRHAGFRPVATYGSYDGQPYRTDSTNIIAVARPL